MSAPSFSVTRRSLCRARGFCRGLHQRSPAVLSQRSLCRAPTLSVSGPCSLPAPGGLCVGAWRSLRRAPALSLSRRSPCQAPALFQRCLCRAPALRVPPMIPSASRRVPPAWHISYQILGIFPNDFPRDRSSLVLEKLVVDVPALQAPSSDPCATHPTWRVPFFQEGENPKPIANLSLICLFVCLCYC